MRFDVAEARLPLAPGRTVRLQLAPQARLRGVAGQTWLTLDHDRRDISLGPGDEFVARDGGPAVVTALHADGPAELWIRA